MNRKRMWIGWVLAVAGLVGGGSGRAAAGLAALDRELVVAADGSAPFRSIQAAVDAIPADNRERVVVRIRAGLYNEKVRIDQDRITLRGESREEVVIRYHAPRPEYDRRVDRAGPGVVNVFGNDIILEELTIDNSQTNTGVHAFALYGQPDRLILADCNLYSQGGDTVSLWNTAFGRYYHVRCQFRGGVDFVCPRGWCFVRDSEFDSTNGSAILWHDGHMDPDMKFVVADSRFEGPADFRLGRNHYPSQFYLLDCTFAEAMADEPIRTVKDFGGIADTSAYERKYFHNCHREGGDVAWHADNLAAAPGAPAPEEITARWTFGGTWDPEGAAPPVVTAVETDGADVHVYFSEPVAGASGVRVLREDGVPTSASHAGDGTRQLVFTGGNPDSPPVRLDVPGDTLYGTVAALRSRFVPSQRLPSPTPRRVRTVLAIGDSTVASYAADHASQGWAWALDQLLDDRIAVINKARGGRSSKSFRTEGLWDEARQIPAHYVFVQFGHNDNPGKGPERETDPGPDGDFRENLRRYIREVREMGAVPILLSPPMRRRYTEAGVLPADDGNQAYADAARTVATELDCAFVDLRGLTRALFDGLGEDASHWIQPEGDRTHFTPAGARRIASLVLGAVQHEAPTLAPYILPDALTRPERP
jgi:pectinesterase